jgi:hypothetical protein
MCTAYIQAMSGGTGKGCWVTDGKCHLSWLYTGRVYGACHCCHTHLSSAVVVPLVPSAAAVCAQG